MSSPESNARRRLGLALALGLSASLGACIVVPVGRPHDGRSRSDGDDYGGEVVTVAPPAPQVDVVIAAPGPGFFWIGGYWAWVGGRHVWIGGRWQAHRPGLRWVPYGWYRQPGGWRARPGRWEKG